MKALIGQMRVELTLFLRDKTVIFFSLFFPLVTVAFFGYLNREGQVGEVSYPNFLIAGGIGMVVASAAFENLSTALARQRDAGILKRLGGTPLRVWTLVGAKVLTAAVVTLAQTLLMVAGNVLLFGAEITGSIFWGLIVLIVGILTFTTMGVALAGLCRNADVASAAGMAISLPMQFLCGTFFPIEEMPALLRHIANALPLTYFVEALRGAILTGGGPLEYGRDWAILLGCLAVAFVVAVRTFRWECPPHSHNYTLNKGVHKCKS
jgi:ABC-2 type transport system permease protein